MQRPSVTEISILSVNDKSERVTEENYPEISKNGGGGGGDLPDAKADSLKRL